MKEIGLYKNRKVFWIDYSNLLKGKIPNKNCICIATSSKTKPNINAFDVFTRKLIENKILEFKGHGVFGELLHDCFDETIVDMEVMENHPDIEIMTTWHNNQSLADAFWQCLHATCLPDDVDKNDLKIVCTDLDSINRENELKEYLNRFKNGWLPKTKNE